MTIRATQAVKTKTNRFKLLLLALASLWLKSADAGAQTNSPAEIPTLCVMTYNVRYANANPGEAWTNRLPIMRELIQKISPDIFGSQEGLYLQVKDLAAALPDYDWIGEGREGGSHGEFMAVFFRKARLEPVEFRHFWLSDTPEVIGSRTWEAKLPRMVTQVKYRDRRTTREFFLFNTHFDHQAQSAREKSAALVRSRIGDLKTTLPVLLIGDFNSAAEKNKAYDILTEGNFLTDLWKTAPQRINEGIGTFNGFKGARPNGQRIDWILARGDVAVEKAELVTFARDGQFPSDHFPVVTWLKIGAKP